MGGNILAYCQLALWLPVALLTHPPPPSPKFRGRYRTGPGFSIYHWANAIRPYIKSKLIYLMVLCTKKFTHLHLYQPNKTLPLPLQKTQIP